MNYNAYYEEKGTGDSDYKLEEEHKYRFSRRYVALSYAMKFNDKFSVGATYNTPVMKKTKQETENKRNTGKEEYTVETSVQGGSHLVLGAAIDISEKVTISGLYRSGYEFELEDIEYDYFTDDPFVLLQYLGVYDTEYREKGELSKIEYKVPSMMGVGVTFRPTEKVTIFGELQSRPWGDVEKNKEDLDIDNATSYSLAVEFIASGIPIRAGVYSTPLPILKEQTNDGDEKATRLVGWTVGAGLVSGSWILDGYATVSFCIV